MSVSIACKPDFRIGLCRTDKQVHEYIYTNYMPDATAAEVTQLLEYYPSDVTEGSPYGTGTKNARTPQFKRLASLQGDLTFQAPRRFFLQYASGRQNTWTYRAYQVTSVSILLLLIK